MISHNATKWLKNPVKKAFTRDENPVFFLEIPVKISAESNIRAENDNIAWDSEKISIFALLTDENKRQYLQEIVLDLKSDASETSIEVFDRDLQDLAEIEAAPQSVSKELHNYRRIYSSLGKVEKTYPCRYYDSESQTVLEGQLSLTSTTKMGDAIYAYYGGTVTGIKEGRIFI